MNAREQTTIREAREPDVPGILDLFAATYGRDYPYAGFMDEAWLKRAVFNDNLLMLVAEAGEKTGGNILGTASVVFDVGTHSDLLGELGRLVVSAEARGLGIGTQLMAGRLERIRERLHVAIVENRTPHPFSQRISLDFDFAPVGFLPLKRRFDARESIALFAKHFDGALELRRNNPRLLPEAQDLAHAVFSNCRLPLDIIIDEEAPPYPQDSGFRIDDFSRAGLPALLRIERGRLAGREVFGPVRLQYGAFALSARHADYLLARPDGPADGEAPIAGAIGYIHDEVERSVRIFELIASNDRAVRFLLESLLDRCQTQLRAEYLEIDVSANAPRMQRTLLELGFLPIAYVPAMVFHRVERLDVLKMARLLVAPDFGDMSLTPGARALADLVGASFREQAVLPEVAEALHRLDLLHGLSAEQTRRVAAACKVARYHSGEPLFEEGSEAREVHVVLEGSVEVRPSADGPPLGRVKAGESLGEIALLTRQPHSARAIALESVRTATLDRRGFESLARQRPDIATILLRNLAVGLGTKLQRLGATVTADDDPENRGLIW